MGSYKVMRVLVATGLGVTLAGAVLAGPPQAFRLPSPLRLINFPLTGDKKMLKTAQETSKVLHANERDFAQLVLDSEAPVLVDFYADWCGPCRMLSPHLESLARETTGKVVKVNVDQNPTLARRYGVSSIPFLVVFKDGQPVLQHTGLANKQDLKAMLEE